jgi:hypothetical protein
VLAAREIPPDAAWYPTAKQEEFLTADEDEVLYGGAAGSGKTDGLLIDAMGLAPSIMAITKRSYQAIIFRRTYPDLKDLIDRAHELYPPVMKGVTYDKAAHVWQWPSGARIEFGFIQRDIERFRYRGRAFQYVGWEELTLWPTKLPYMYLLSRLRSTDPSIPVFCRGTTNPDGPGFRWVKEHWKIQDGGSSTAFEVELIDETSGETFIWTRRFIAARLSDNPYLAREYRANLLLMEKDEQDALLRGFWKAPQIKGAFYGAEMAAARNEGRITKVPYDRRVPVDTYWDFGLTTNGTTAIWCAQRVSLQDRFLRAMESADESLSFFTKWLLDQGFSYGTHYLPHDADTRRLGKDDTRSYKQMLKELMPGHTFVVVPRIHDVDLGIKMTKDKIAQCYFDEEGCAEGVAALENYRRKVLEEKQTMGKPLHDWASNYADAFRQYGQSVKKLKFAPQAGYEGRIQTDPGIGL